MRRLDGLDRCSCADSTLLVARGRVAHPLATSYGGQGGVLVNISSGAATLGSRAEYVQHAASKAGVDPLVPLGRAGEPGEIGDAVPWMSDEASYVTGTTLRFAAGR